jgi:hypothetical protein
MDPERQGADGSPEPLVPGRRQTGPADQPTSALPGAADPGDPEALTAHEALNEAGVRPVFPHPQWMVGVVLIFALLFIAGGLGNPLWLLVGSPFILVLVVYIWVKVASRGRRDDRSAGG